MPHNWVCGHAADIKKYANVGEGLSLTGSGVKNAKPMIEKWLKNNGLI